MLASLLRPKKRREYAQSSQFASRYAADESRWPLLNENEGYNGIREHRAGLENAEEESVEDEDADEEDEAAPIESTPLLPIFSAPHLDILPVFDITRSIRSLIISRCDVNLTWEQLRSPQISQFLVKPILQKIKEVHFSRATLYALMTNCLQFDREVHLNPGNSGTNQTRAMVSELLAIKLLRDYTTRELIDALSYDFYPLQGQKADGDRWPSAGGSKSRPGAARISCLEVAIRAQAKRFLAHPLVIKQLEAIWAGTIVFHSAADSLHRASTQARFEQGPVPYGATSSGNRFSDKNLGSGASSLRRSVTLYNPRDASPFKLSRLRVPRYRQFLSTCSFAVLLGLFLAVLQERSIGITLLEVLFWFWSAGFMLDELINFNEQGFSLYLMSFWNIFDIGILVLLFCFYCMRLYGAVVPYAPKQEVAERAYDILAANAVLLFPRLFSVLDHYRYFSQLLIAFRIMASDLVAVFVLIVIACSGFLVACLSIGQDETPASVAYALFQMVMGFTPAAWTLWDEYGFLGRVILTMFLFICHFVIMTILITVLTNSFMRIVQNANQEHQFLFAVNTISMVKSDALFSYVAPTNIFAWLITPLRWMIPFRQYVRLNRTIIKITHMPILFTICAYEKMILSPQMIEATDLIDRPVQFTTGDHSRHRFRALSTRVSRLIREPSVATFQQDRALAEVFRQPFGGRSSRSPARAIQRKSNLVNEWMQGMGSGPVNPPDEQDSDEVDRLERMPKGRFPFRRRQTRSLRDFTESIASNLDDHIPQAISSPVTPRNGRNLLPDRARRFSHHTDIEGDNELTSDDNSSTEQRSNSKDSDDESSRGQSGGLVQGKTGKTTPKFYSSRPSTAKRRSRKNSPNRFSRHHSRHPSGTTILYNPVSSSHDDETDPASPSVRPRIIPSHSISVASTNRNTLERRHSLDAGRTLNSNIFRSNPMSVPNMGNILGPDLGHSSWHHEASALAGLGSDLGDGKAIANGFVGGVPSSFTTQMAYATGGIRRRDSPNRDQDRLSKLVLARMNNIEEGFREVIKEVKDLRSSRNQSRLDEQRTSQRDKRRAEKKKAPGSRKSKTSDGTRTAEPTLAGNGSDMNEYDDV